MKLGKREYIDVSVCWAREASTLRGIVINKEYETKIPCWLQWQGNLF
jgi:hypothetical protein